MRFKSLLLAATGLLALAGATANVDARDALQQREVKVAAFEHAGDGDPLERPAGEMVCPPCWRQVGNKCGKQAKFCSHRIDHGQDFESGLDESVDVGAPGTEIEAYESEILIDADRVSYCTNTCYSPHDECVKNCGGTKECGLKCFCDMFSDPEALCRREECVGAPKYPYCSSLESRREQAPGFPICLEKCTMPFSKCVRECGGTAECKTKCECKLFSDPKSECRHYKCVDAPRGCSALESGNDQSLSSRRGACSNHCWPKIRDCFKKCGENSECAKKCACEFSTPDDICRRANCLKLPNDCPSLKEVQVRGLPGFPTFTNQCPACNIGYDNCKKNCRPGDKACVNDCGCRFADQFYCVGCKIPCANKKPSVETRDDTSISAARGLPGFPTSTNQCGACLFGYNNCKKNCRLGNKACIGDCGCGFKAQYQCLGCGISCPKTDLAIESRDDSPVDDFDPAIVGPGPNQYSCQACAWAIGDCKKKCSVDGACDESCNCNFQSSPKCKGCKVPCPPRRRNDISARDFDPVIFGPGPNQHSCRECGSALDSCKKKCAEPGACDESCNCNLRNYRKCSGCKVSCPLQRRLDDRSPEDEVHDDHAVDTSMKDPHTAEECDEWVYRCRKLCGLKLKCVNFCHCAIRQRFPACRANDHIPCKTDDGATAVNAKSLVVRAPPPGNPCDMCKASLLRCQSHCNNHPACLNYCSCMHKDVFPTCKECKLSCTPTAETESAKETGLMLMHPAPATIDRDVCDSCESGVRLCRASCPIGDGDCYNTCACAFKANAPQCRKCDIQCDQAAFLQYGSVESQAKKPSCNDNPKCVPIPVPPYCVPIFGCSPYPPPAIKRDVDEIAGVESVPNPCVVCRTGIKSCQNKCNGDKGCENQCSCTFKKTLQCKECDIPCDSASSIAYDDLVSSQACSPKCVPVSVPPYCMPAYGCQPIGPPPAGKRDEIDMAEVEKNPPCKICTAGNKACQKACGEDYVCKAECQKAWMSVKECRDCVFKED